jgi:hypothetical protein
MWYDSLVSVPRTLYARSGDVHLAYQVIGEGNRERDLVLVLDWTSHLEAIWEQAFVEEFLSSLTRVGRARASRSTTAANTRSRACPSDGRFMPPTDSSDRCALRKLAP